MKKIRLTALILAMIFVVTAFAGCNTSNGGITTTATPTDPEAPTTQAPTTTESPSTTEATDSTSTVPENTTTSPNGITSLPDNTTSISDSTTTVPEVTTSVPDSTTALPDVTTTPPDNTEPETPAEPLYVRVDASGNEDAQGSYILFGSWPQSEETDSGVISILNGKAGTPEDQGWTSYKYYIQSSNTTDFMWYIDIDLDGDGEYDHRGVYFDQYRPAVMSDRSSVNCTYQDDNEYATGNVYWFSWEPIKWQILAEENGEALLFCEMIIDSQEYYHSLADYFVGGPGNTIYPNNYERSNIRAWLINVFYTQAFNDLQKTIIKTTEVDNSASSTSDAGNNITQAPNYYCCENTQDKVFLLSEKEVTDSKYGFGVYNAKDLAKQKKTTDYSQCQGAYTTNFGGNYDGNGDWWLRSPYNDAKKVNTVVGYGCMTNKADVNLTSYGVCPALWITL